MSVESVLSLPEIFTLLLLLLIIFLIVFFHIQTHSTDCRGGLVSKTITSDGNECTRQAKLSIHDRL